MILILPGGDWHVFNKVDVIIHSFEKIKRGLYQIRIGELMDYTVHGILQARILELVAFPFSKGSSQPRN